MAESIKDKVAIIGAGCTKFGELWNKSYEDLVVEASYEAFEDAGIGPEDIEACWVGLGTPITQTGGAVSIPLKLDYKPVTRVENACGTGTEAMRNAVFAVAAKVYDLVLVVGMEKLKDTGAGFGAAFNLPVYHPVYEVGFSAPGFYALAATRYFRRYGLSPDQGKRALAKISVKSHHNGARNPRAHLRTEITEDTVMGAPILAWPLGLFDCCGVSDGAAAVIICPAEMAKNFRKDYVLIKGMGVSAGPGQGGIRTDYDYTSWTETEYAAKEAYAQAGIKNPRKELSMLEVHDCFSIAELIAVESLGVCEKGKGHQDVANGAWNQEGEIPVNLSGGLKSFGHPIGASGCREAFEIYKQLQGKAEDPSRQLKNPRMGLCQNQGGVPGKFYCALAIYGLPD